MGLTYAKISLSNPRIMDLKAIEETALVDSGALMLCMPEHIATQLKLDLLEKREVQTADGKSHSVPYVGPVRVEFENRYCFVGALVLGNELLLGAVPMEDMDLIIHPSRQVLMANPANPNMPSYKIK